MARRPRTSEARQLAWRVLNAVEDGAYADAVLGSALAGAALAPRDRALATRLVYGTLAWQGLLDQALTRLGRPPEQLDAAVRTLLRMALFQLIKLDRVPEFAAVDTAVELARTIKGGAPSGLVNALLRRFLREQPALGAPPGADRAAVLASEYSHPQWLVERWLAELGAAETEALLAADNEPAPTVLRVHAARISRAALLEAFAAADLTARPTTYAPDGVVLEAPLDPAQLPGHAAGWFAVQGEASQLVGLLVGAGPGDRVLDACAAPGGKSLALACAVGERGLVVAGDLHGAGLARAQREAVRLGVRVAALQADAATPPFRAGQQFDAVLVDAPCSGLGTLRQHPEIRWRRTPDDLAALADLQANLLAAVSSAVRPGGVLVYATCTIARIENDDVLDRFLAAHPAFRIEDPRPLLPAAAHALLDARGILRTAPHRHGLDGFFAARLRLASGGDPR